MGFNLLWPTPLHPTLCSRHCIIWSRTFGFHRVCESGADTVFVVQVAPVYEVSALAERDDGNTMEPVVASTGWSELEKG